MKNTVILAPDGILIIAVTPSPLPVFFTKSGRPEFVPEVVTAIFPAHLMTDKGCYHTCIVEFAGNLSETFSRIAAAYAGETEREAHELSHAEESALLV